MPRPGEADFEYIVVGSGAGGGPLAANLARAGHSVLLLEAGGDDEPDCYSVPAYHALATEDAALSWAYFVRHYESDAAQQRDSKFVAARDGVFYPRAATIGGCTAHNAMITIYPHNHDWDEIATATQDPSWSSARMRSYFERLERCSYEPRPWRIGGGRRPWDWLARLPWIGDRFANHGRHGFRGWLSTSLASPVIALTDGELLRVILAAAETGLSAHLGRPLAALERLDDYPDPNDWRVQMDGTEGLWLVPMATRNGRRNSTREYIASASTRAGRSGRLEVRPHTLAGRILFGDGNRAIGVEYHPGAHLYRADPAASPGPLPAAGQVYASREVILAAGTFNTPQLLMLSGIGPKADLESLGIDVRVDLPGVGANLQDRYEVGVVSRMKSNFRITQGCGFEDSEGDAADPCFQEWKRGRGVYTSNGAVLAITKRSQPGLPDPDLFIFGLPAYFRGYYPGYSRALERGRDLFTWAILKAHTRNTAGTVGLRSTDPRDVPAINFHYFGEGNDTQGEDLAALVDALGFVRGILRRMDDVMDAELLPGPAVQSQAEVEQFVKDNAWGHHASSTCKIGSRADPNAVLDSAFRVRGVSKLRVVDASVFPRIPGFFIVSAVYMVSEKASEAILSEVGN